MEMKKYTEYDSYSEYSQIMIWFWEIVSEFDDYMKSSLIQFISGMQNTSKIKNFKFFKDHINCLMMDLKSLLLK